MNYFIRVLCASDVPNLFKYWYFHYIACVSFGRDHFVCGRHFVACFPDWFGRLFAKTNLFRVYFVCLTSPHRSACIRENSRKSAQTKFTLSSLGWVHCNTIFFLLKFVHFFCVFYLLCINVCSSFFSYIVFPHLPSPYISSQFGSNKYFKLLSSGLKPIAWKSMSNFLPNLFLEHWSATDSVERKKLLSRNCILSIGKGLATAYFFYHRIKSSPILLYNSHFLSFIE